MRSSGRSLSSPRLEALAAKDGTALCRPERYGSLLSASRTGSLRLDLGVTVILSGHWCCPEHGDPFCFAGLAAFGFVFKLLIVKEKLFPGCENKIAPTVDTLQHLVLKFH
jgi:hypothetical protein